MRGRALLACLLSVPLLGAAPAPALAPPLAPPLAPVLKPMTTLDAPVVRVRDLFAHAGAEADRVLGPGPAPGGRIVVAAQQLAYIARRYEVDWRPGSPADRAVLARPGRRFSRVEALAALRPALAGAGAGTDARIALDRFDPPLVPTDTKVVVTVAAVAYDPGSGRFSAVLALSGARMAPVSLALAGTAQRMVAVPVAVAALPAGSVIGQGDLRIARRPVASLPGAVARRADQAVGMQTLRMVAPGAPFVLAALGPPVLVRKDAAVLIHIDQPGIALTAEGRALQAGGAGDAIRVLNPTSHAVLRARVIAAGEVRVSPDAPPLVPAGGMRPGGALR